MDLEITMDLQYWIDRGYDETIHQPAMRGEEMIGYTRIPSEAPIETIEIITRRSFMKRFTLDERTALRNSEDDVVQDFLFELNISQDVTLSLPENRDALMYLTSIGILEASRVDEILAPGTIEET